MSPESDATVELEFRQMTARADRIEAAYWRHVKLLWTRPDVGFDKFDSRARDAFFAGLDIGREACALALQEVGG